MARHTLTMTTGLALTATAALLTACGGASGTGKAADAKGTGRRSGGPSASATASPGSGRPDVSVPGDLDLLFDFAKPSDADEAAALEDAANYIRALNHGIAKQNPEDPAFQFYSAGQAAQYAHTQIKDYVAGGWTLTGKDRYYRAATNPGGESTKVNTVRVPFCEDQSKVYGREVRSKKVHRTEESLASYQRFTLLMTAEHGSPVWRAQQVTVAERATECRR